MRKGCRLILKKIWPKYSQWRSFSKSNPVPCTNSFRGNDCAYWLVVWPICLNFILCFLLEIPLNKDPNSSSISETLEYRIYLLLTNLAALRCTLSTLSLLYFWYGSQTVAPYSLKERIREKEAVCLSLSFSVQPFRLRRKNESLELALFVMVAICFDHSKSLLRVTPRYLASMTSSSTCPVSE